MRTEILECEMKCEGNRRKRVDKGNEQWKKQRKEEEKKYRS